MAQPTGAILNIDRPLTNISLAYIQSADAFIADKIFPTVPVEARSDLYYTYTKNDWFRDEAQIRPPGTESAGSGYNLATANYNCDVFAIHKDVNDQDLQNALAPLNLEAEAARFVAQRMMLRREIEWSAAFFTTGIWGTDNTPGVLWSTYATSTPLADVETAKRTVLLNTGFMPNVGVMGYDVWIQLLNHPQIVDRIKYTTSDAVTLQILARYFGLDRLYVAQGVKATNVEGGTAAMAFVQGKHFLVCYVPPAPGLLTPSAGYTFAWTGVSDGAGMSVGTTRFYMPEKRSWRIESQMAWDSKVVASDLGYLLASVVA